VSAHLRSLVIKCAHYNCGQPATHALLSTYNAHLADYCGPHAKQALKKALAREYAGMPRAEGTAN
jgi:hypothetical protein